MKNGPLAPVAVLRNAAETIFTCTVCKDWGIGSEWMYDHADSTGHDDYRGELTQLGLWQR